MNQQRIGERKMKHLTQEEQNFISAIQDYQKEQDKLFLSYIDILKIVKNLGYSITLDELERKDRS